jgi:hypothetical protein
MGKVNIYTRQMPLLSEIYFPLFGYVITINSEIPDRRLFERTHFFLYRHDDFRALGMEPVVLDRATLVPGDYRTTDEVKEESVRQIEEKRRAKNYLQAETDA